MKLNRPLILLFLVHIFSIISCHQEPKVEPLTLSNGDHVILIGNNLCSRMINYDHFETQIQLLNVDKNITVRNMCDGGDTPGFRPHSGRNDPWAFPGAEKFQTEFANTSGSEGHLDYPDTWLKNYKADHILAFFGYVESFEGAEGLPRFTEELQAFITHTKSQKYNGKAAPNLVLISPIAFEDLSDTYDLPNGKVENNNLALYVKAMGTIAQKNGLRFIDVFHPSQDWYSKDKEALTIDGFQLNDKGYKKLASHLVENLFSKNADSSPSYSKVYEAVKEKNWHWHNDFKIPNGVHVFGRRYEPFGSENYPSELQKIKEMTLIRDTAIWKTLKGEPFDVLQADSHTTKLPDILTNYKPLPGMNVGYLYGDDALNSFKLADGAKIELFASEKEFSDLANPVQLSFDNKGRLWVAVMPSYPHYKPGDAKPNDKLLILEDTNNDGRADKQITFADHLHLPIGFEFAPEGVYVSQGSNLKLLTDTNGDDKADKEEIILSGFDDHDTHHAISAFCADPSGAIFMAEGVFLHTNVETSYGTVRCTNGGFLRYSPQRKHLERTAQLSIPNPWGIAFDDWGQNIFAETSGPDVRWMMPGSIKPVYGKAAPASPTLFESGHMVRPTSGLEFVSSRHFPEEMQGDLLINNTIGFLGTKQHTIIDDGTGYTSCHQQDLVTSSDGNFRPVDMEFAPDGSLYLIDWHNTLIGHMQHNARDPLRDHEHGRIYRITYPGRPLVTPAKVHKATIEELLDNLKLPEYRTRYRSRRELRSRNPQDVLASVSHWTKSLQRSDKNYEHHLLEALWVTWSLNQVDQVLLNKLLLAKDYKARAAAVRVLRYVGHQVKNQNTLLQKAALDVHGRVRLEAIVAASWLDKKDAMPILSNAAKMPLDHWMKESYDAIIENFTTRIKKKEVQERRPAYTTLKGKDLALFKTGEILYHKEGNCATCHQHDGKGLESSGFPPLAMTDWVNGDTEKLIKISLNGLYGPMEVNGKKYEGKVPMTAFGGMLNDEELAGVLTYIRNQFGNKSSAVYPETVKKVRAETKEKKGFYTKAELEK